MSDYYLCCCWIIRRQVGNIGMLSLCDCLNVKWVLMFPCGCNEMVRCMQWCIHWMIIICTFDDDAFYDLGINGYAHLKWVGW